MSGPINRPLWSEKRYQAKVDALREMIANRRANVASGLDFVLCEQPRASKLLFHSLGFPRTFGGCSSGRLGQSSCDFRLGGLDPEGGAKKSLGFSRKQSGVGPNLVAVLEFLTLFCIYQGGHSLIVA